MNAVEFVKKYGIDNVRNFVTNKPVDSEGVYISGCELVPTYLKMIDGEYFFYWNGYFSKSCQKTYKKIDENGRICNVNHLKQIVEAFELVEKVGGLDNAKTFDESCMYCIDHLTTFGDLKQAINLVEQCQND